MKLCFFETFFVLVMLLCFYAFPCHCRIPHPFDFALGAIAVFQTSQSLHDIFAMESMAYNYVIAGVIGTKKPSYDVWGRIVNVVSRMEHNSVPGRILVNDELARLLANDFLLEGRDEIDRREGLQSDETHFLNGRK